jgi:crotonobetainyl-CoA:carnitine CoA-transferase CaiB-like acyl-CoA transferase
MIVEVPHPLGGTAKMPGNPIKLSDTHEDTFSPPPTLGQHTQEIFTALLGKTDAELAELKAEGVI